MYRNHLSTTCHYGNICGIPKLLTLGQHTTSKSTRAFLVSSVSVPSYDQLRLAPRLAIDRSSQLCRTSTGGRRGPRRGACTLIGPLQPALSTCPKLVVFTSFGLWMSKFPQRCEESSVIWSPMTESLSVARRCAPLLSSGRRLELCRRLVRETRRPQRALGLRELFR